MESKQNVTIIIPVYGDWDSLKDCIASLSIAVSAQHKVLFVNDCGPDADLLERNIKKDIKGLKHFEYHRNPKNLGFLQNCNRAVFELDKTKNDVMLLNSDTIVTEGFIEELQRVLYATKDIATVSPRSNNATIATIPVKAAPFKGIEPKESYKLFLRMKDRLPLYNTVPVAHGFCMLIRRSVINEYGLFDEVFGKGYGEETDFCQRIAKKGYKSVLSNHSFVFHMEARSFTMETKKKLLAVNDIIIDKRYPNYRREVRNYRIWAENQESEILTPKVLRIISKTKHATKELIKRNSITHSVARKIKSTIRKK